MRQLVRLGVSIVFLLASPVIGSATVIGACNTKLPELCTQSVDINPTGTQFTIVLSNTSTGKGGYITADAFSLPGTLGASLVSATNTSFTLISGDIKVAPVTPVRELLLTIDPTPNAKSSFQGGGSPKSGIAAGSTVTFVFNITGGTLADTFANESIIFASQVTRMRGSSHRRSDNALALLATPGFVVNGDTPNSVTSSTAPVPQGDSLLAPVDTSSSVAFSALAIPEAASFLLLGVGLITLRIVAKKRNGRR